MVLLYIFFSQWESLSEMKGLGINTYVLCKGNNGDLDPAANTKQKVEARQTGVVVAGVTVSLAFGIVLVFVTLLLMVKKRRNEET